jgi:uncharacterized protein (UPF0332 family)
MTAEIDRARDDVAAAQLLGTKGFDVQAVSIAFRAALHAAEVALLVVGETRSADAEVVSVFIRRVVRERGLDREAGRLLRSLFNRSRQADHTYRDLPPTEATAAVRDATTVIDAVAAWLDEPVRTPDGRVPRRIAGPPPKPVRRRR